MGRRIGLLLWVFNALACSGETALSLRFPEREPEVRSIIIAYEEPDRVFLEALPADGQPVSSLAGGFLSVTVLYYRQTLDALGLEPGLFDPVGPERCLARRLPLDPVAVHRSELDAEPSFEAIARLPEALAELRYPAPCPCAGFTEVTRIPVRSSFVESLVPLDDGALFVVTQDELFILGADGQREMLPRRGWRHGPAHRAPDGRIWMGTQTSSRSELIRLDPSLTGAELSTRTPTRIIRLAGSPPGEPFELFALEISGALWHLDSSGRWTQARGPEPKLTSQAADLIWTAPGACMALPDAGAGIIHYDADTRAAQLEHWDQLQGPCSALGPIPGLGIYAATRTHNLYAFERIGSWVLLMPGGRTSSHFGTIRGFLPFGGGFLFAGQDGRFGQLHPELGFCFDRNLEDAGTLRHLARLGDDQLVLAGERVGDNALIVLRQGPDMP